MLVWYVIQVINGREDVMRERIERVVPAGAMEELFYPQFLTEIKVHGEWVNTTKPLFPGYLICDTADPRTVQQYLLRMDDFARVLAQDGQFVPLAKEDAFFHWVFVIARTVLNFANRDRRYCVFVTGAVDSMKLFFVVCPVRPLHAGAF